MTDTPQRPRDTTPGGTFSRGAASEGPSSWPPKQCPLEQPCRRTSIPDTPTFHQISNLLRTGDTRTFMTYNKSELLENGIFKEDTQDYSPLITPGYWGDVKMLYRFLNARSRLSFSSRRGRALEGHGPQARVCIALSWSLGGLLRRHVCSESPAIDLGPSHARAASSAGKSVSAEPPSPTGQRGRQCWEGSGTRPHTPLTSVLETTSTEVQIALKWAARKEEQAVEIPNGSPR